MPTESELREQFHEGEPSPGSIDLDAVLRRSRARRRPQLAAVGVVSALAVLAIVVPLSVSGVFGQLGVASGSSASVADGGAKAPQFANESGGGSSESGSGAADGSGAVSGVAPAEKVNLCAGSLADLAPATDGLVLSVHPVDAAATDRDIQTTVTLTNTGSRGFSGSASPFPALTLSRDGTVLWHSNGPVAQLVQEIDLAPGASTTFTTVFQPLVCGVADDEAGSFREGLPAAGPGTYRLSAVLDVTDGAGARTLVSGSAVAVTLH